MDYSLTDSDHIWVFDYHKSTRSALSDPRVLALLAKYLPPEFSLARTKSGRPFAQSSQGTCVDFSIAHSKNLLVVALSQNNIGVDIEFMKPRAQAQKISKKYFSKAEPHESLTDFYYSWTAREAYIKAKAQNIFKLTNIHVNSTNQVWHIGEKNNLDYRVDFMLWAEDKYLIAVCRESSQDKKISYLNT